MIVQQKGLKVVCFYMNSFCLGSWGCFRHELYKVKLFYGLSR